MMRYLGRLLVASVCSLAFPALAQLAWDFAPFERGSGKVSIILDTNRFTSDEVLESASIQVRFKDQRGVEIARANYQLIREGHGIAAGRIVQVDARHPYTTSASVDASSIAWATHLLGGKADRVNQTALRGVSERPQEIRQLAAEATDQLHFKRCAAYADMAKEAHQINIRRQCGLPNSTRWSDNFGVHYTWCLSASQAEIDTETRVRTRLLLKQCMNRCAVYADMATAAQSINIDRQCEFAASNRWSDNFGFHDGWCRNTAPADVESEAVVRTSELTQHCGGR